MYVCMYVCMYIYIYICQRSSGKTSANMLLNVDLDEPFGTLWN